MPRAIRRVAAPTNRSRSPSRRVAACASATAAAPGPGFGAAAGAGTEAAAAAAAASCWRGRVRSCGRAASGCRPSWEVGCSVTRGIPSVRAGCMRQSPRGASLCPGKRGKNNGCHRMPPMKGPKPSAAEMADRRPLRQRTRRAGSGRRACLHPLVVARATARNVRVRGPSLRTTGVVTCGQFRCGARWLRRSALRATGPADRSARRVLPGSHDGIRAGVRSQSSGSGGTCHPGSGRQCSQPSRNGDPQPVITSTAARPASRTRRAVPGSIRPTC